LGILQQTATPTPFQGLSGDKTKGTKQSTAAGTAGTEATAANLQNGNASASNGNNAANSNGTAQQQQEGKLRTWHIGWVGKTGFAGN
jgi:hypothetical protein